MQLPDNHETPIGVLTSGGLDSSILIARLADLGFTVQPFYIRSDLHWEFAELDALEAFCIAAKSPRIREPVVLHSPSRDIYGDHWSVTGEGIPDAESPDEAVLLPGRNALLALKAIMWCQRHGLRSLALATLSTSPFGDASVGFFEHMQQLSTFTGESQIELVLPFSTLSKRDVMRLGAGYPLEFTFSCLAPVKTGHCGRCNKCAERRRAFASVGRKDLTCYVQDGMEQALQNSF